MPVDAAIPLGFKASEINPPDVIGGYQKAIALKNLMSEQALREQQILQSKQQTANLEAEAVQRQRDNADQNFLTEALHDPEYQKAFASGDPATLTKYLGGKIQGKNIDGQIQASLATAKNVEGLQAEKRKTLSEMSGEVASMISGLDPKNDQAAAEQMNEAIRGLKSKYPEQAQLAPPEVTADNVRDVAKKLAAGANVTKEVMDAAQARVEKQAKIDKDAADTALANAHAVETGVDTETKRTKLPVEKAISEATLHDRALLTPEQRAQENDRLVAQKQKEREIMISGGHLKVAQDEYKLKQAKQEMELGPHAVQTWTDILKDNPDAVKEIPAALHSAVAEKFRADTGLPMPTAAGGNAQQTETAARNALDNAAFIKGAIKNPEIQKSLGTILGRLGDAEQHIGESVRGLSPEAQILAQELRTRMRYFVFQEGKATLGGRLPQQLMKELETSSASVHMNAPTLEGALNGAVGAASTSLENIDKERFGGRARSPLLRKVPVRTFTDKKTGHKIVSDYNGNTFYDAETHKEMEK